jgi:hypothetical protein
MIFFSQFKKKNVEFMGSRLKLDLIFGEGWGAGGQPDLVLLGLMRTSWGVGVGTRPSSSWG